VGWLAPSRLRLLSSKACIAALIVAMSAGCGKKPDAGKADDNKASPKAADKGSAAKPAAEKPSKPKPPDLGLPVDKFTQARIVQLCATKHGESDEDALVVAIHMLLGHGHAPPPEPAAAAAVAPGAAAAAAKAAANSAASAAAKAAAAKGEAAAKAADKAKKVNPLTPAGRPPLSAEVKESVDKYQKAVSLLPKRPDVAKPIDDAVKKCRYAKEIGLIDDDLVKRYVDTFVGISCLQITMRDKSGKVDPLKHAEASITLFKKNNFTARDFSRLGLVLARFDDITTQAHTQRRDKCPDPLEIARQAQLQGRFVGGFKGKMGGALAFEAKDGEVKGTASFTTGKLKGTSWALKGAMNADRAHLFGREKSDWIRFEGKPGKGLSTGKWEGEVALKKVSGKWTWRRPPPPKPAKGAAPAKAKAP